jgi:hypothetical protein
MKVVKDFSWHGMIFDNFEEIFIIDEFVVKIELNKFLSRYCTCSWSRQSSRVIFFIILYGIPIKELIPWNKIIYLIFRFI